MPWIYSLSDDFGKNNNILRRCEARFDFPSLIQVSLKCRTHYIVRGREGEGVVVFGVGGGRVRGENEAKDTTNEEDQNEVNEAQKQPSFSNPSAVVGGSGSAALCKAVHKTGKYGISLSPNQRI